MSHKAANAELDRKNAEEASSIQVPPAPEDIQTTVSSPLDLAIPTRKFPLGQLSSGSQEVWVPYNIHTAKCDRCGEHNTSVVQRSSRESKQFCKACMYLNVHDGIYSVNVEGLEWSAQTVSIKRRLRDTSKPRKPRQPKRLAVTPTPTRVPKRKPKEQKTPTSKRMRLSGKRENGSRSENSLFVADDGDSEEGEETDNDVGFGQLLTSSCFPSAGQETSSAGSTHPAETAESLRSGDGNGQRPENKEEKETENNSERDTKKPELPPWWESTQASLSNVREESREDLWGSNDHLSLIERRRSEFSPEAIVAAEILLMLAQAPREFQLHA